MDPINALFGPPLVPPAKLKVYAPNGDTKEIIGFLSLRVHQAYPGIIELFLCSENGTSEILNKKVVVKNMETGMVCYDPRTCITVSKSEKRWLAENPHWPAILELWDNPVGEESEGLNPYGNELG